MLFATCSCRELVLNAGIQSLNSGLSLESDGSF